MFMLDPALYLLQNIFKVRLIIEEIWDTVDNGFFSLTEAYGKSPFKCSVLSCSRFQDGFTSKESRDRHQATHQDRFKCPFKGCDYSVLGFTKNYELSKHLLEHKSLPEIAVFPKVQSFSLRKSLEDAIDRNDMLSVRTLSEEATTLPVRDHGFLLRAIKKGSLQAAKTLLPILGTKEDFEHQDKSGKDSVVAAAMNGDEELMSLMIENSVCRSAITMWNTPLMASAKRGNAGIASLILAEFGLGSGINLDVIRASIRLAVDGGHEELLLVLLDKGGEACAQHKDYYKVIKAAATQKRESVVRLLLEKGNELNAVASYPALLRECAPKGIDAMIAQLMPKAGAENNAEEESRLALAAESGDLAGVLLLLDGGANADELFPPFMTGALEIAAEMGHEAVVELLLDRGADIQTFKHRVNALVRAIYRGHQRIVKLLLDRGADINARYIDQSPLAFAVWRQHREIACLLLERGATFDVTNEYGNALQQAVEKGHDAIISLIDEWRGGQAPGESNWKLKMAISSPDALTDYQIQMFMLERQNRKRLLMARQEQDNNTTKAN